MTNQICHFSKLPKWFNREKYAAAEFLDLAGWCEQFAVRYDIWQRMFSPTTDRNEAISSGKTRAQVMLALPKIREKPIVDIDEDDLLKDCFCHGPLGELKKGSIYSRSVRLATIFDIHMIGQRIEERPGKALRYLAALTDSENNSEEEFSNINVDELDIPVDDITRWRGEPLTIRIDALVSKKVMLKQLEEVLEPFYKLLAAEDVSIPKRRKGDLYDWFRFGVLPFIDLTIWARENRVVIPYRVMADAIFPPGEGGEETIRKTTRNLFKEVLTPSFLQTLSAEAALEKAERNFDD